MNLIAHANDAATLRPVSAAAAAAADDDDDDGGGGTDATAPAFLLLLSRCFRMHIITPSEPAPQSHVTLPRAGHEGQRAHLQALGQREALAQLDRQVLRGRRSRQPAPKATRMRVVVGGGGADAARRNATRQQGGMSYLEPPAADPGESVPPAGPPRRRVGDLKKQ